MNWLINEIKEKIDQLEVTFATVFEDFEHHLQEEILGCKGKDNPDVTKLRNEIKQLKPKNEKKPEIVINHYKENDNPQWQQKRVPMNNSYRDALQ